MSAIHDVAVVGGGVMGAATTWAIARRGQRVVMLDRFARGHARGSSHGSTRVYRLGYEDPDYISMARQSLPLWRDLEARSGTSLLQLTGVIDHGPAGAVSPVIAAFNTHGVPHEVVDAVESARRWPGMRFDEVVVHHDGGGRVRAQRTVDVLHSLAADAGATLAFDTKVHDIDGDGPFDIHLPDRRSLQARSVVVTAGAWTTGLLADRVDLPALQVSAEQPMVFRPTASDPIDWIPFVHRGHEDKYGLGQPGHGVKVADHYRDEWLDPDDRPFDLDADATDRLRDYVARWLPGLDPEPMNGHRCLYTTTADKDFVLDRVGGLVIGAGFSGHGFKFAPLIGEILADLAEGETQTNPRFSVSRDRRAFGGVK